MKIPLLGQQPHQPKPRKIAQCAGCGGLTDGRHLDRELLKEARTDDAVRRDQPR